MIGFFTIDNHKYILGAFFALLLCALTASFSAQAQITPTSRVQLVTPGDSAPLSRHIYITKDPEQRLNYRIVINRHENNSRGVLQEEDVIDLGALHSPVWMVFSVVNNTNNQDWILDFGNFVEGRSAMAHKILVHNHTLGQSFTRALRQTGREDDPPRGARIPVRISNEGVNLFVVFFEAEGPLPALISPSLEPGGIYAQNINPSATSLLTKDKMFLCFLILMAGFFAALAGLQRRFYYLFFTGYIIANIALLICINTTFYTAGVLTNDSITALTTLGFIFHLFGAKWFLAVNTEDGQDIKAFLIWGALIVLAGLANILIWSSSHLMGFAGFSLLYIAGFVSLFYIAVRQAQFGKTYAVPFALGCGALVIGGMISFAGYTGFISTAPATMHAIWIGLLVQNLFYAYGGLRKFRLIEEDKMQQQLRESREAETQARLKQSKESADQARLLRVIERERELMAELREREMQRTEEMRIAKEQADEANRAKSAFLAVVSHEIRTPMTGLMGMIRLLLDSKLNAQQHDYMLAMQKSGDTMLALLNDILDFEKIESGSMELENVPFDLPRLAQGVVTLMSAHAGEKGLTLKADIKNGVPQYVKGDPTRLRQVLLNLVNNALKFTEDGGVTIHLKAARVENLPPEIKGDYEIYFAVSDTGIGISQEAQDKLFTPFSQADSSISRKFGGTGLGLTICKRLVEAMGGAITLTSKEGEGSTFSYSLLMENAQGETATEGEATLSQEEKTSEEPVSRIPSKSVLIVDDNEMNRKVMEGFLSKMGHKTAQSASAEDTLERLAHESYDAIFMDINMNGMNGVDATRTIRGLPTPAAETPVIALTGNVRDEDIEEYYKANLNGFVAKPVSPEALAEALEKLHEGRLDNPVDTSVTQAVPSQETEDDTEEDTHKQIDETTDTGGLGFADEKQSKESTFHFPSPPISEDDLLDWDMLDSLLDSIGADQLKGLVTGFLDKAEELVDALQETLKNEDLAQMGGRAHELKGMAANFGMAGLSKISAGVESAARSGELKDAKALAAQMPEVYQTSKTAINNWLADKN